MMNAKEHNRAEWIKRMEETFAGTNGIVGENSLAFANNEIENQKAKPFVHNGLYVRLMDSFFDFSVRSFQTIINKSELYDISLLFSSLWTLRSAYNLFWQGYYCQANGLLRSAFESIILLASEKSNTSQRFTLCQLMEKAQRQNTALWDMKADCINLTKNAFACMIGKKSRLPADEQKVFADFLNVLHAHVHLSFFSFFVLFRSGKETGRIGILPKFDNTSAGTFVYASKAIAWTHLRFQWSLWNPLPVDSGLRKQFSALNDAFLYSTSDWAPVCSKAWQNFLNINFPQKTE